MKHKLQAAVRTFVSLALIIILLYIMRGNYDKVLATLTRTSVPIFLVSLVLFFIATAIASLRLMLIIKAQGGIPISFKETFSLTLIGYFFNNFLPTAIGGDVAKAYYLSKKRVGKLDSFASVFIDRVIGLFTMIFMAFAALFMVDSNIIDKGVKQSIYAITAVSFIAVVFMINKGFAKKFSPVLALMRPIEQKLKDAYNMVHKYRHHNLLMARSFAISIVSQIVFFIGIGMAALSIGCHIRVIDVIFRMPIVGIMCLLPSINGLGVREGSTVLLFSPLIGKENAFAVSILWLAILMITSVVGGIIYAVSPQFKMKIKDIQE